MIADPFQPHTAATLTCTASAAAAGNPPRPRPESNLYAESTIYGTPSPVGCINSARLWSCVAEAFTGAVVSRSGGPPRENSSTYLIRRPRFSPSIRWHRSARSLQYFSDAPHLRYLDPPITCLAGAEEVTGATIPSRGSS
jgi:hypothetical protein